MKSIKYISAAILMALMAVVSCRKDSGMQEAGNGDFGKGEKMTFRAYASPVSKSYLSSSDDYTENEGTLYWDNSDRVGILSIYLNNEDEEFASRFNAYWSSLAADYPADGSYIGLTVDKYITSAVTTVVPDTDQSTVATLYSSVAKEDWFANSDEAVEGKKAYYDFVGIYPMSSDPEFRIVAKRPSGKILLGIPVNNVSSVQYYADGFGKYHVCMDNGLDTTDEEEFGLYTMSGVLAGSEPVSFNDFSPLTALLQFDIRSDSSNPVMLQNLRIHSENNDVMLAGEAYVISNGPIKYIYQYDGSRVSEILLDLHDGNYPAITNTSDGKVYSVVVLPSYKHGIPYDGSYVDASEYDFLSSYGGETLVFEGYDVFGQKVFEAKKVMPEYGFESGKRYCFTLELTTVDTDPLPGEFSVSATEKVAFSRGNLTYSGLWNSDYNRLWYFHSLQQRRVFDFNQENLVLNKSTSMDCFGWATAGVPNPGGDYGSDEGHTEYRVWSSSEDPHAYGPSTTTLPGNTTWRGDACEPYCEWGRNHNLETWLGQGWRTLSREEWDYLINGRAITNRFIKGKVGDIPGMFIFADEYTGDMSKFPAAGINDGTASFDGCEISYYDLANYQQYGLLFLPANGVRKGNDLDAVDATGAYWSSTPAEDSEDAYALVFEDSEVVVERFWRPCGLSVRLIKDIENNPDPNLGTGAGNAGSYGQGTL